MRRTDVQLQENKDFFVTAQFPVLIPANMSTYVCRESIVVFFCARNSPRKLDLQTSY